MKQILILLSIIYFIDINAQTDQNFIIRTNLSYQFNHNDKYDVQSTNFQNYPGGIKINGFNANLGLGREIKSNFYLGVGISCNLTREEINPDVEFPDIPANSGYFVINGYNYSKTTGNTLSPFIFVNYFKNISEKIEVSLDLYAKYGFRKDITKMEYYQPDIENKTYVKSGFESRTEISKQFFSTGISPSVKFQLFKNAGIEFTFGKIEYNLKLKDSRFGSHEFKSSDLLVNFKPEHWLFGFYFKF